MEADREMAGWGRNRLTSVCTFNFSSGLRVWGADVSGSLHMISLHLSNEYLLIESCIYSRHRGYGGERRRIKSALWELPF